MSGSDSFKLLVAVDQSSQAAEAVRYAAELAKGADWEITVLHVRRDLPAKAQDRPKGDGQVRAWWDHESRALAELVQEARGQFLDAGLASANVNARVRDLNVGLARDLISEAEQGYDAVALGRTGISRVKDLLLGTVASKLLSKLTKVPLWVVGGSPSPGRYLVALDGSPGSEKAVEHLARAIAGRPAQVCLYHVIRSLEHGGVHASNFITGEVEERLNRQALADIQPAMDRARDHLVQAAGLAPEDVSFKVVTGVFSRAGAIVEEAQKDGWDTIVVGRRGVSKVEEFFIGSVSSKVLTFTHDRAVWIVG